MKIENLWFKIDIKSLREFHWEVDRVDIVALARLNRICFVRWCQSCISGYVVHI